MNDMDGKLLPLSLDVIVLECRDVALLADFYIRFLGWKANPGGDGEWIDISHPSGGPKIAFQRNDDYVPPVWPDEPGCLQQMIHLDFSVRDKEHLEAAVAHAVACGAAVAGAQYGEDEWIMLDPAGHPFCLVIPNGKL
jgi:catechol 2,3-dioxygenase-like lactoylglutathione lyase family enzyme